MLPGRGTNAAMGAAATISTFEIRDWEAQPGRHVVVASGEIDLHAAPSLDDVLESVREQSPQDIVLDMSDASFVDSAAIGVLVGHIKAAGTPLTLVCTNPNVLRVLQVSGLARVLVIRASVDDALGEEMPQEAETEATQGYVPRTIEMRVAPKASELARVRGFAAAAAFRFGLDPRQRYDFTVAANEAVANAIQHGRPCDDDTIHVLVTEDEGRLTLAVRDAGTFELAPPPDDPLPESGRGLTLMSHLVDGVALSRDDGHTHVELSMQRA
jgi:anti-anti-sigma factor